MLNQHDSVLVKLVDAPTLLDRMFDESSRPSLRTLRTWQKSRIIPHVKLGRLIFFDESKVRAALAKRTRG